MAVDSCFAGVDVGTSFIKAVLIGAEGGIEGRSVERLGADLQPTLEKAFQGLLEDAGIAREGIQHITATGFGRKNVGFADDVKTEIACHARGASFHFPGPITVVDIGGQDTKVIRLDDQGKRIGFKMNRKCAAGTGTFLEEIAAKIQIPLDEMNGFARKSRNDVALNSYCTVFASTEIFTRIKDGEPAEDMVKSAYASIARRVVEMDALVGTVVLTGGVAAYNDIMIDMMEKHVQGSVIAPPEPQLCGALGAALLARESR
jgi:predicted CoA-substrate-specific enzyme activase